MLEQPQLHVARDRWDPVATRVGELADAIGLREFAFEVRYDPSLTEIATCSVWEGRAYAVIAIGPQFEGLDERERDAALLHEVVHALLDPLYRHVKDLADDLAPAQYRTVERVFRRDLERATDRLAVAFESLLAPGQGLGSGVR